MSPDDAGTPGRTAGPRAAGLSAPVAAVPADGGQAVAPALTVDPATGMDPPAAALDVAGTPEDGAAVLMGQDPSGSEPAVVLVSAAGRLSDPVAVPDLDTGADIHVLPDGTALVSGRLAAEAALGYTLVDPARGTSHSIAAVPLDEATSRATGAAAISPDGRTVWLYSAMLVDGRFSYLLTGHDTATGEFVASRDLFPELRGTHLPEQELDLVGLAHSPDGGVLLAVNTYPRETSPFARPVLLVYDAALEPVGEPVALAPEAALVTARALATAGDGTAFVTLRGPTHGWLVALRPGSRAPEPRLELTGFGLTDELALDAQGRAVLPGRAGARRIELSTGSTTDIDLGCTGVASVQAFDDAPVAGTWVLGDCLEAGRLKPRLWRVD